MTAGPARPVGTTIDSATMGRVNPGRFSYSLPAGKRDGPEAVPSVRVASEASTSRSRRQVPTSGITREHSPNRSGFRGHCLGPLIIYFRGKPRREARRRGGVVFWLHGARAIRSDHPPGEGGRQTVEPRMSGSRGAQNEGNKKPGNFLGCDDLPLLRFRAGTKAEKRKPRKALRTPR